MWEPTELPPPCTRVQRRKRANRVVMMLKRMPLGGPLLSSACWPRCRARSPYSLLALALTPLPTHWTEGGIRRKWIPAVREGPRWGRWTRRALPPKLEEETNQSPLQQGWPEKPCATAAD